MRTPIALRHASALAALLLAGTATGAQAQFSGDPASGASDAPTSAPAEPGRAAKRAEGRRSQRQVDVSPYLEVGQVLTADLRNGGDVLTYTNVAVGIDAAIVTNRAELAATLRYEHRFGWGGDSGDSDTISGLARGEKRP